MDSDIYTNIAQLLELTEQQFQILRAIDIATTEGINISPKYIQKYYTAQTQKPIQKPNLFSQLRHLLSLNYISKAGEANYIVNKDQIKSTFVKKKEIFLGKVDVCNILITDLDQIFVSKSKFLSNTFVPRGEFYKVAKELLLSTDTFYNLSRFSTLTINDSVCEKLGMTDYMKLLKSRLEQGKLKFICLTEIDGVSLYELMLQLFASKTDAYKHTISALNNLLNDIYISKIDIRYDNQRAEQMFLYSGSDGSTLFIPITHNNDFLGVIRITSENVTDVYRRAFLNRFENAEPLKGEFLKEIVKKEINKVTEIYKK